MSMKETFAESLKNVPIRIDIPDGTYSSATITRVDTNEPIENATDMYIHIQPGRSIRVTMELIHILYEKHTIEYESVTCNNPEMHIVALANPVDVGVSYPMDIDILGQDKDE